MSDVDSADEVFRDFVVPENAAGQRIDLFLTQACDGFSRSQIRKAVLFDFRKIDIEQTMKEPPCADMWRDWPGVRAV